MQKISADRMQLQQVLLNLFTNAVEAMGSVPDRARTLSIKSEIHDRDGVLITIKDTGPGIDPLNMDRIFDAFFTTNRQRNGDGILHLPFDHRSVMAAAFGQRLVAPTVPFFI